MFRLYSVRYNVVFCRPQEQVVHVLWPVCCARVRRSALHEREAEAEPASAFSAVVTQPGYLQVSHLVFLPHPFGTAVICISITTGLPA